MIPHIAALRARHFSNQCIIEKHLHLLRVASAYYMNLESPAMQMRTRHRPARVPCLINTPASFDDNFVIVLNIFAAADTICH
jgi:hypothetical protein